MNTPEATELRREPVIEVDKMTLNFGSKIVHENLNLSVYRGETVAIVGASGSGKSTLLRVMAKLQSPLTGSVRVLGEDVTKMGRAHLQEMRRRLGVLFQNGALFGGMSAMENIAVPLHEHTGLSSQLINEIACVKLALVGLSPADGLLYPNQLSGGMNKRVALARAIALDPELLFLDEPTSGLDPMNAAAFDELILKLKSALRPTIVIVTHDMDSLWRIADRVVLVGEKHLLADGSMEELLHSQDPAVVQFFQNSRMHATTQSSAQQSR